MCTEDGMALAPPPADPTKPSAHEQRHGESFQGFIPPFGCSARRRSLNRGRAKAADALGNETRPGISMGHRCSSGRKWSSDYYVLDADSYANAGGGKLCLTLRVREVVLKRLVYWPIKVAALSRRTMGFLPWTGRSIGAHP